MSLSRTMQAVVADITTLSVDVIVNAANSTLLGGGGVDGAIHHRAGRELLKECRTLGGCKTGEAKITSGYGLPARYVIHAVGPVWHGGNCNEAELLASCYINSLQIAFERGLKTIAFSAISTGVYGYPKEQAARVAVNTVSDFLENKGAELDVIFCCFSEVDFKIYESLLNSF